MNQQKNRTIMYKALFVQIRTMYIQQKLCYIKQNPLSLSFQYFLCTLGIRIGWFQVQAPLGARLGLRTQP